MDAKDSRAEATLTERSSDGGTKFALQYDRSKGLDAGASAFKGDAAGARPCAVIGPDRVVPPARDGPKKPPAEPWLAPDPVYRRLSDYPHKMSDHKDPSRNISPRQTFQENMQRIIMPPGYNAIKTHEDPPYAPKNKLNVPLEVKYCEVPYNINPISSDQKHVRNTDHSASNVNPLLMRGVPHGWPAGSVNVRSLRPYGAPEVLQYPDYANCPAPRPVLSRTHSSGQDEFQQLYADPYYHENNVRFKPYPNIKERYPQARYEYIGNYPNPYHPPHSYAHKYELPKTMPSHTYSGYPPVPVKYTERVSEPVMDGYQRAFTQQGNYPVPIRNPVIHPPYRPGPGTQMQNKLHPYPPDGQHKSPVPNKLPYDPSSKMYLDYDTRSKPLPMTDNYYLNELPRPYHAKNIVLPNYGPASMHGVNPHPYYIKEMPMKNYEYAHFKNMDHSMINHSLTKLPPQYSPSTLAISPADSNISNETAQTHGTSQEDCGYVSQSSVASVRSIESLNRIPMDLYGRYDYRYGPVVQTSPSSKPGPNSSQETKSKNDIRQFISSWSEGDDENTESNAKKDGVRTVHDGKHNFSKQYEAVNNQEQLYVLGLVNVPSEELSKYEHIQKVSKLPENIKGYNSLELLNQFEEAIESSNITSVKPPTPRAIQMPLKSIPHRQDPIPRAVSPLDVEAKISQSVIHKDVGCNFEIKPCSPKMMNVEVATPMQTLLNERVIEKVANPHNVKSPIILQSMDESIDSTLIKKSMKCPVPNTASSCKMINGRHLSGSSAIDHLKTNYSLQDLESNSGVCLASLPRLDTDIELNFPEVNQQFINANKTDSVITASFTKDVPALDADRSDSTLKNTEYDMNYQFSPKTETETDFSKLSKYRKLKRNVPDTNNTALAKAQAARVDSVIIKNPDNTRGHEDNNDTSSGYYRNDFQEFAMNLVSQVKTAKANHQSEMDKMFSTSGINTNTSKYDEVNIHSPSGFIIQKSGNLTNKPLNEVEDTNHVVHIQSDLSKLSKDLSNRHLEKGSLDIPMNLSPKAKYSATGVDEEIKNNRSNDNNNDRNAITDGKHRLDVQNSGLGKNSEKKHTSTTAVSLDKTDDTIIDLRPKNINVSSNDIREEPIVKLNNLNTCSSSDFSKERNDVEFDKNNHIVPHIEKDHPSTKTTYSEEQIVFEKLTGGLNLPENVDKTKEVDQINGLFSDKGELYSDEISNKNAIDSSHREHDILSKKDRKKYVRKSHVSKVKRKKHKTDLTHRKRSTERSSATIADENTKNNVEGQKFNTSLISEITASGTEELKHSTNEEKRSISGGIITEGRNRTENSIRSECTDNIENETSSALLTDNASKNYSEENHTDVSEDIKNNCSDIIKDSIPLSLLPREEYCKLLLKCQSEVTQNSLTMDVVSIVTKDDKTNTSQGLMSTDTDLHLDDPVISSNIPQGAILLFDRLQSEEKPSKLSNACIDSNEKEIATPTISDQYEINNKETVINANIDCEQKEFNTPIILNKENKRQNDKLIYSGNEELKHSTNEEQRSISGGVITEGRNTTENSIRSECTDNIENETSSALLTDNASKNYSEENHTDVSEDIKNNCSDIIKDSIPLSLLPREEYCKLLLKCRSEVTQNSLTMDVVNIVTKDDKKNTTQGLISTDTDLHLDDPVISSNIPQGDDAGAILLFDRLESEEKPSKLSNACIDSNEKEIATPTISDQYEINNKETVINANIDCEQKEFNTPIILNKENKRQNDKLINTNIDRETEELDTPAHAVQNETEVKHIPPKNEDQDIQMHHTEDNSLNECSQHDTKVFSSGNTKTKTYTHLNKELFSPRIQNLLVFNEIYDIFNGVSESKTTDIKSTLQKLETNSHDPVVQDGTHQVDTVQHTNETSDDSHIILHSPKDAELTGKLPDEITEKRADEKLNVKSTEDFNNSTNADIDLKEQVENEIFIDNIETPVLDIQVNSHENFGSSIVDGPFDKSEEDIIEDTFNKSVEDVVTKSPGEDIVPEHDIHSENNDNHELVAGSTDDNIETDTCEANFIVIDQTTSGTPEPSIEYEPSKIDALDGSSYDFDKKMQPFSRNFSGRPRCSLKRSLSDSALNAYDDNVDDSEKRCFMLPKRKKITDISNLDESHLLNIIQSSRRNSISTLCNENFSFCILIDDNCIVAGENYEQENEFIQFDNGSLNPVHKDSIEDNEKCPSPVYNAVDQNENNSDSYITKGDEEKSWDDNVGCEETIETEDIAENIVIGEPASPKDTDISDYESDDEHIGVLNNDVVDHTSKVKHIYGDNMCTNDAQLVDALYRTPQMDVNRKLMDRESQVTERNTKYYDSDSLEMMLSEPINNIRHVPTESNIDVNSSIFQKSNSQKENKDSTCLQVLPYLVSSLSTNIDVPNKENIESIKDLPEPIISDKAQDENIHLCESSLDRVFSYMHKGDSSYTSSSSPEVSSTTSEEKNSSILLKISSCEGSRTSEIKKITQKENSCKFTEKEYMNPNYNNGTSTKRPLLTKAAQKYIPPIKESIPDLKVKLALPQQSLLKLQKNKEAKEEPKLSARSSTNSSTSNHKSRKEIPKKIKPKFEDVLKNIDEVQFQMHKEKNKKTKKYIPKVVIKKSENGSHYASTSSKDAFNPDLTGRKWQPWVFIEKNEFIDKMALRNKTRAVFSHRSKSFVLAEKVYRYKSISSAKFIISQPKIKDFSAGNLKYTIKLKHTY